ncbi:hypothetical protein PV04_01437 [Phialophora macrospora]|uniref:F-box domain-containing protein n=1 Tax=Phialophora macrospora TaxID=1851006 RepID=A0A0D2D6V8_9EURO|nr:hypothetical protein PV04_01437 [Phialophora macrospora]
MADNVAFRMPESILVTLRNAQSTSNGSFAVNLFHRLPAELWFMILSLTDYRTMVLMALSCKGMAAVVLNTQAFKFAAATEEAEHKTLGHHEYVIKCFNEKAESRSKLYCSHFLCPFYMKNIWTWAKNVKSVAKKLEEERKKALEQKKHKKAAKMLKGGRKTQAPRQKGN